MKFEYLFHVIVYKKKSLVSIVKKDFIKQDRFRSM